jgi:NlpC/P60 family putative phage cell wall peptidase
MYPTRTRIIAEARAWIGTPYRHQASRKGVGCDCLGLVRGVWRALIGEEPQITPAYSRDWAEASGEESLAQRRAPI